MQQECESVYTEKVFYTNDTNLYYNFNILFCYFLLLCVRIYHALRCNAKPPTKNHKLMFCSGLLLVPASQLTCLNFLCKVFVSYKKANIDKIKELLKHYTLSCLPNLFMSFGWLRKISRVRLRKISSKPLGIWNSFEYLFCPVSFIVYSSLSLSLSLNLN
jgi:hypothetical protein